MKGEREIAAYVEAQRAYTALKDNAVIADDIPCYEVKLKQSKVAVKSAYAMLNGGQLGEARRRLGSCPV